MKVSSPIGELPFEPRRISRHGTTVAIDGVMGAWPARVEIAAADLPALARLLARPALAVFGVVAVTAFAVRRTRS
ncbi:hypothetical protein [Amycolatopsis jejuensis]|uniref:hypothetical protein n=1 Tax=Amycolatopsis jejuensis TaxID=330084 RepID=UPI0005254D92|nr:hypothetical protein [Amycolatopsis jejuensis]